MLFHQAGKSGIGVELILKSLSIRPDYFDAHFNLGINHLRIGDRGAALDEYKILKELDKERANALFNLIYE